MEGMGCEGHKAPFLGINTHKSKCCIVFKDADDEKVILSGPAETTYAINKNHVIAKCQVEIPEEIANEVVAPVNGRNQVELCHIGVKHKGKATGSGGTAELFCIKHTIQINRIIFSSEQNLFFQV